jgi:hypothetical protein
MLTSIHIPKAELALNNKYLSLGSHPRIHEAVDKMMWTGWVRPNEGFQVVKKRICEQNEDVVRRLLRDL